MFYRRDPKAPSGGTRVRLLAKRFKSSCWILASTVVKNPPANTGDVVDLGSSLGPEDPLEEEMATHSSILA